MKTVKTLLPILLLSFIIVSCGDDPASVEEDPPELPTFENISPDLTYFDQNIESSSPAYTASVYASSFSYMSQLGTIYSSYFAEADRDEAEYDDGTWTWEYNYSWAGESVTIVLESEELENEIRWSMTWSYSGENENVENYTMVEGTMALDESYGSWKFNDLDPETGEHFALMETTWEVESETSGQIETVIYDGATAQGTYLFEWDGAEHTITFSSQNEDETIVVYWNEETGNGYYQDSEGQKCWNSDFEEVACS